jgi:hypothetical protein
MPFANELVTLFTRDLNRLTQQIAEFPNEEALWQTLPGVTNSAGNLALHLEGNLREYVGRQLGGIAYTRQRPLEFSSKGLTRAELIARIENVRDAVIPALANAGMEATFPENVLGEPLSVRHFALHLYGHLNYHLGQVNYLRRILG